MQITKIVLMYTNESSTVIEFMEKLVLCELWKKVLA